MIRIVGIQRSNQPSEEFVILQNQGSLRIQLRGHVLVSELAVASGSFSAGAFIFSDDALIPAGMFVLLATGEGESRWARSKDGSLVFHTYMNRSEAVWEHTSNPIHLMNLQHSYTERPVGLLLR
jgi:hypothetical protein